LNTSQLDDNTSTFAVGTILLTMYSGGEFLPSDTALSFLIQESLMTFATQAGLKVIEFKTMPSIKTSAQADKILNIQVSEFSSTISADYFLTGTYML
jgi:TolB-like protein